MASEPQYIDHLAPIMHALPDESKGVAFIINNGHNNFLTAEKSAYDHNLTVYPCATPHLFTADIEKQICALGDPSKSALMIASWRDQIHARTITNVSKRLIRIEHGAGQNYSDGKNNAFVGGAAHGDLLATLCPGEASGLIVKDKFPNLPIALIGCPKLDWVRYRKPVKHDKLTVAIAFRYKSNTDIPECQSAFEFFRTDIEKLQSDPDLRIIAHGHPFALDTVAPWWKLLGIPYLNNFEDVIEQADVLLVDNSSIAFEWLLVKRPNAILGLMNSPEYRKFINHGMRFWQITQQPDVVQIAPGVIDAEYLKQLPNAVSNFNFDEELSKIYAVELGRAALTAASKILKLIETDTNENDQVRFKQTIDYHGLKYNGECYWFKKPDAAELIKAKYADRVTYGIPPELIKPQITLSDKQNWTISNFARYVQLVIKEV